MAEEIKLTVQHVLSGNEVVFKNIKVTGFSDDITTNWNQETVYGRMDPIVTYQGTTRKISLNFDLGPFTLSDDRKRLALIKISRLMKFQYPSYEFVGNAHSISRPPILRVSMANYIRAGSGEGLLCYMDGMSYTPVDGMNSTTVAKVSGGQILPQRIAVSFGLNVLHEASEGQGIGWDNAGNWQGGDNWGKFQEPTDPEIATDPAGLEDDMPESEKEKQIKQLEDLGIL